MREATANRHAARRSYSRGARTFVLLACMISAGCKQILYNNLSEQSANEMLVTLLVSGVASASKSSDDAGKTWVLDVDRSELIPAMQALQSHGLPHATHDNLGALFKKDGLVSTPAEERVRFIYGLSQELDSTLSQIDGVLTARVQIVLPNNDPLATDIKPSSASVFIKSRSGSDVSRMIPQIKALVVHSVEGLAYDQVSVVIVPAEEPSVASPSPAHSIGSWWMISLAGVIGMLVVAALFTGGWLLYRRRAESAQSENDGRTGLTS